MLPRMAVDLIANAVRCGRRATDQSFAPLAGVLLNSAHWFVGRLHEGLDTHEHGLVLDLGNPIFHWSHPQIADVAMIPVANDEGAKSRTPVWGAAHPSEVTDFIAPRMAHYKRIRHVEFIESIPKSPSGKILRRVLMERERASQRSAPA